MARSMPRRTDVPRHSCPQMNGSMPARYPTHKHTKAYLVQCNAA